MHNYLTANVAFRLHCSSCPNLKCLQELLAMLNHVNILAPSLQLHTV